jgi:hypothetical protein
MYVLSQDLSFGHFSQVFCALAFTVFQPMQSVYTHVWSETLLITLTLWFIHFLIASQFSRKSQLNWILALLCAAAASLTRAIGVLMSGVFLIVSWQRKKAGQTSIMSSILFVVGPMIACSLRNQILYGSLSMTHEVIDCIAWEKHFYQFLFILESISHNALVLTLFAAFVLMCLAAPFIGPIYPWIRKIRFKLDISKVSIFTVLFSVIGLVIAVIALSADNIGFGGDPETGLKQIAITLMGILVVFISWFQNTNLLEYGYAWKADNDSAR